jgi:hypothetical protein
MAAHHHKPAKGLLGDHSLSPLPHSSIYANDHTMVQTSPSTSNVLQVRQLRRFLIEIIAFSFGVSTIRLSAALGDPFAPFMSASKTSSGLASNPSILSDRERGKLLHLARLVQHLHRKNQNDELHTTQNAFRSEVYGSIIKPAKDLNIYPAFALELIANYADHYCIYWDCTLLAQRRPSILEFRHWVLRNVFLSALNDVTLIITKEENIEVYRILANGLVEYQNRYWFVSVKTSSTGVSPVSAGFASLHKSLEWGRGAAPRIIRYGRSGRGQSLQCT